MANDDDDHDELATVPSEKHVPALNDAERGEVDRRMPPRAAVLHEPIGETGRGELNRNPSALMWSGLAAGLSMGFSMVASGILMSHLPDAPPFHLLAAFGYSTGTHSTERK